MEAPLHRRVGTSALHCGVMWPEADVSGLWEQARACLHTSLFLPWACGHSHPCGFLPDWETGGVCHLRAWKGYTPGSLRLAWTASCVRTQQIPNASMAGTGGRSAAVTRGGQGAGSPEEPPETRNRGALARGMALVSVSPGWPSIGERPWTQPQVQLAWTRVCGKPRPGLQQRS